jgi:hypothetical protein
MLVSAAGYGTSAEERRSLATRLAGHADTIFKGVWEHDAVPLAR